MKFKIIFLLMTCFLLVGCGYQSTGDISPQGILKNNPEEDLFLMDNVSYVNADKIDWVKELEPYKPGRSLGKIIKTDVKKNFQNFNATKLPVETEIFELQGRNDIIIAKINDKFIPYLKWVEG